MPTPPMIAASMSTFRKSLASTLLACFAVACAPSGDPQFRRANPAGEPVAVSQLAVSGNACGPAALINSIRFADARWQVATRVIDGETDRGQLFTIIRRHGMRPSPHLGGRPRWSRSGVNVIDLADIANEITTATGLPEIHHEILVLHRNETAAQQLARTHRRLETSLARGLPPVLSIRRFALRKNAAGSGEWTAIDAHFVTITEVPRRLPRNAESFAVGYIDPWGAHHRTGEIHLAPPSPPATPFPEARFPQANVGKDQIRPGEKTRLIASAVIGHW